MQYIVTGYDGKDKNATSRRQAVRKDHIAIGDKLRAEGKALYGVTLLDDSGKMIGSVYIVDFKTRRDLNAWLKIEPYVTGKVWKKIEIKNCKVGPSFEGSLGR